MAEVIKFWDHGTSPSTYCIKHEGDIVFRGAYSDGMLFIKASKNGGKIDFIDDYIPAMRKLKKTCYRALMVEKELRREIIKLKKELKNI
jgi:hypothetical protein